MPNLYATPQEIKSAMPDGIRTTTVSYDALFLRLGERISRFIDNHCKREFYPRLATRYFNGSGECELFLPDLLSVTSVEISTDGGLTYTALSSSDYFATVEGDFNSTMSFTRLIVNVNSSALSIWPTGQRSVKIAGEWGYADDRDTAWESSADTVEDNPLTSSGTSITVNDADGIDLWGVTPRFQAGQVLKIESEYAEVTVVNATENKLTVVRGRNGSTGASHAQNTAISIWRPPEPVKQAAIIQAVRQMERGLQGFGEARANTEIGQLFFLKSLDPEAQIMLQPYIWPFLEN